MVIFWLMGVMMTMIMVFYAPPVTSFPIVIVINFFSSPGISHIYYITGKNNEKTIFKNVDWDEFIFEEMKIRLIVCKILAHLKR